MENQQKVWKIGVSETGDAEWEHHRPRAETEEGARKQALDESDFSNPRIYMVAGPFEEV